MEYLNSLKLKRQQCEVPHDLLVTFLNGDKVTYTTRILHGPDGLLTDPMVVEIVDLFTGKVIYTAA